MEVVCRIDQSQQKEEAPGPSTRETRPELLGDPSRAAQAAASLPAVTGDSTQGIARRGSSRSLGPSVCGRGALAQLIACMADCCAAPAEGQLVATPPPPHEPHGQQRPGGLVQGPRRHLGCSRALQVTSQELAKSLPWGQVDPLPQSEQQGLVPGGPSCPVATLATPASLLCQQ